MHRRDSDTIPSFTRGNIDDATLSRRASTPNLGNTVDHRSYDFRNTHSDANPRTRHI